MDEIIERLTSKHGIDRFLTGGCGAFAVALYMDLKRRGKQPTIVTILRRESHNVVELDFTDDTAPYCSYNDPQVDVDIVSHVVVEVDGKEYDARGEVSSEEWIQETKDLLGPLINLDDDAWSIVRTEPLDPNVQLKHFDLNYSFNEPQDQLYAELAELINLPTTK